MAEYQRDENADGKMKGEKSQITRKECKRLKEDVQDDGLMAKKRLWTLNGQEDTGRTKRIAKESA